MKKLFSLFALLACFCCFPIAGCGSGETQVIEAPPETEQVDPAMEGMSETEQESYDPSS